MSTSTPSLVPTHLLSDLGNAQRLLQQHQLHIRYVPTHGWYYWDEQRWQHDPHTAHLTLLATQTLLSLAEEATALPKNQQDHATAILTHIQRSTTPGRLAAMLQLTSLDPAIRIPHSALDAHPHLLTVANGTLNLRTGELTPHDPTHLLTRLVPFPYHPTATSQLWTDFLDQITNHDSNLIAYLQRAIGYSLCATPIEACLFLLLGSGRNGKRTFLNALAHTFGDLAQSTPIATFTSPPRSGPAATALATTLPGTRLLTTTCSSTHQKLDLAVLTRLTATDPLNLPLGRHLTTFQPTFVAWMSARALPQLPDDLPACWHRLKIISFPVCFADQPNPHLLSQLQSAAPAILAWAVQGALLWHQSGLNEPTSVRTTTTTIRAEQDLIAEFIRDCCTLDIDATVKAHALYLAYVHWSQQRRERPLTETAFLLQIQSHGYQRERKSSGKIYHGLALVVPSTSPYPMPGSTPYANSMSAMPASTPYANSMPGMPGSTPSSTYPSPHFNLGNPPTPALPVSVPFPNTMPGMPGSSPFPHQPSPHSNLAIPPTPDLPGYASSSTHPSLHTNSDVPLPTPMPGLPPFTSSSHNGLTFQPSSPGSSPTMPDLPGSSHHPHNPEPSPTHQPPTLQGVPPDQLGWADRPSIYAPNSPWSLPNQDRYPLAPNSSSYDIPHIPDGYDFPGTSGLY